MLLIYRRCFVGLWLVVKSVTGCFGVAQIEVPLPLKLMEKGKSGADFLQLLGNEQFIAEIQSLAGDLVNRGDVSKAFPHQLRLETALGHWQVALKALMMYRQEPGNEYAYVHYELFLKSKLRQGSEKDAFPESLEKVMHQVLGELDAMAFFKASQFSGFNLQQARDHLESLLAKLSQKPSLEGSEAMELALFLQDYWVFDQLFPHALTYLEKERSRLFSVKNDVMIQTPDGAMVSAIMVRPTKHKGKQPTLMQFNIYTHDQRNLQTALEMAAHGYVGLVADARGKRLSQDTIRPYETEAGDVNAVIAWICNQPWSDGRVGMFGGSYLGFAQWAAAKNLHPGLKTIVPYVAAIPGQGLPMENNIFLNANYGWAFHVTNNRFMDQTIYQQPERWNRLNDQYYQKGIAYRSLDALDGQPNPWLQRWLNHPSYDSYWQAMVPYQEEFKKIDIPILSITGYYDDGQISAIHYFSEHETYRPNSEHYLVIGPYDHFTAQTKPAKWLRGYELDTAAALDVSVLTYQWMDYVFNGGAKPKLLKDKVNYQVMGGNRWNHAPSLKAIREKSTKLYFSSVRSQAVKGPQVFEWLSDAEPVPSSLNQNVDLKDRTTEHNDYYPWPIVRESLEIPNGLVFVSSPMAQDMVLAGRFSGQVEVRINKRDFDMGLVLYELTAEGNYFHLSYFLGRASYAKDMAQRNLLIPGQWEKLPIERTRMTGRLVKKGSRLMVLVNVNKNRFAQVNYGTGKDVSDETLANAEEQLRIEWRTTSYLNIPLQPDIEQEAILE